MDRLEELRKEINEIDLEMAKLFEKRMHISKEIGEYKKEHNLPILNEKREQEVIANNLSNIKDESLKEYYEKFIKEILSLSKEIQRR